MKKEEIIRVTITEGEIINLIKNHLYENGVEPIGSLRINLDVKDVSEYGDYGSIYGAIINDTIIECKKLSKYQKNNLKIKF